MVHISRYGSLLAGCLFLNLASADDLFFIYQQAIEADPEHKAAEAQADIGTAQKWQALGQMLPQVNATGNWSKNSQRSDPGVRASNRQYPGTRYFVSLNQSLVDFAKFWEWRRASKTEDQYLSESLEARNDLIFNVVDRYFSVLEAEDKLFFIQNERVSTEKQLLQVHKQFEKNLIKVTDVYAIEAHLDQTIADEIESESVLITARQSLKELTGLEHEKLNKLKENITYHEIKGNLNDWINMAKNQNPTLLSKKSAIEAAEDNVAVQKSKYLPVVDFQLNFNENNTGYQNMYNGYDYQTQTAAINVNVPIFSGGITTQQVSEANSKLRLSQYENESTLRALIKETSDAFLTSNANARRIKAAEKALESATKSRISMERSLSYGLETVLDVLKSHQDEYMAKKDLAQAKYAYIKNRVRFMRAIGSINEENLLEINDWLTSDNHKLVLNPNEGIN